MDKEKVLAEEKVLADEKVSAEEKALAKELLTEDELDKVAGGIGEKTGREKIGRGQTGAG